MKEMPSESGSLASSADKLITRIVAGTGMQRHE